MPVTIEMKPNFSVPLHARYIRPQERLVWKTCALHNLVRVPPEILSSEIGPFSCLSGDAWVSGADQ